MTTPKKTVSFADQEQESDEALTRVQPAHASLLPPPPLIRYQTSSDLTTLLDLELCSSPISNANQLAAKQQQSDSTSRPILGSSYPAAQQCRANGSINLLVGAMYSGKTSELLRQFRRQQLAGKRAILVKHTHDRRYEGSGSNNTVWTHDMQKMNALSTGNLQSVWALLCSYDVICIDEGQFFDDLAPVCWNLAEGGKIVYVACLIVDSQLVLFPNVSDLFGLAESVQHLTAVCSCCGRDANFTARLNMLEPAQWQQQQQKSVHLQVGGLETYRSFCRPCFKKHTESQINAHQIRSKLPIWSQH